MDLVGALLGRHVTAVGQHGGGLSYEQLLQMDRNNVKRGVKPAAIRRLRRVSQQPLHRFLCLVSNGFSLLRLHVLLHCTLMLLLHPAGKSDTAGGFTEMSGLLEPAGKC